MTKDWWLNKILPAVVLAVIFSIVGYSTGVIGWSLNRISQYWIEDYSIVLSAGPKCPSGNWFSVGTALIEIEKGDFKKYEVLPSPDGKAKNLAWYMFEDDDNLEAQNKAWDSVKFRVCIKASQKLRSSQ